MTIFHVDGNEVKAKKRNMTGAEIKMAYSMASWLHQLFQERIGQPDIAIHDGEHVDVKGKRFYTVPPATY